MEEVSDKLRQKVWKVSGLGVDMGGLWGLAHEHGFHAAPVRILKVSRIILEHGGACRLDARLCQDCLVGLRPGFGDIARSLDPVDRLETIAQTKRAGDPLTMAERAVGVDQFAPGQGKDRIAQVRCGCHVVERDVMDRIEKRIRVDLVVDHQARKRGAMGLPVRIAQMIGVIMADIEMSCHKLGHLDLDLVKEPRGRRIECVVEIEDPGGHM